MRYYIGNIPSELDGEGLKELVKSVDLICTEAIIINDVESGLSRNFGFAEIAANEKEVIEAFKDYEIDGRTLRVSVARPVEPREKKR